MEKLSLFYSRNKKFEMARGRVIGMLKKLPDNLYYHGMQHTIERVLPASEAVAAKMKVKGRNLLRLRTGALCHDLGYLERYEANEGIGARMAGEILPECGYSRRDIRKIQKIILVTQLPQKPTNILEQIICDADLYYLGGEEYFSLSDNYRRELAEYGKNIEDEKWLELQIDFLTNHNYFTDAARQLRDEGKQSNLDRVKEMFERLKK